MGRREEQLSTALSGVLVVDKPQGPTSHDLVAEARRTLGMRRVGHTGTLDPLATGVLPLVLGHATRLSRFLTGASKGYEATVRLGFATDTYDAAGEPVGPAAGESTVQRIADDDIAAALNAFRGEYEQAPPPFSAKKVAGVRAYALARRRIDVAPARVPVTVHTLELVERQGDRLRLRVEASAGFYVRSLAQDIGARLGCGAHLESLRRVRSGAFTLDAAVSLEMLRSGREMVLDRVIPMEALLPDLPAFDLSESGTRKASHGNPLGPSDGRLRGGAIPPEPGLSRLFAANGRLLALARTTAAGTLQPVVVLG